MKRIESTQNELIKRYSRLNNKKYRDEYALFFIEGKKNVFDSLAYLAFDEVESILATANEVDYLLDCYPHLDDKLVLVPDFVLKKISDYVSDSDILAIVKKRDYSKKITAQYVVYLDRIRDPGNLGTIIRTAAAAGYAVMLDNCCDPFNPKVIRSSMSAMGSIQLMQADFNTIDEYKSLGYKVYGAHLEGRDIFLDNPKGNATTPLIIAIGNEAEGLSSDILSRCDDKVFIPMEKIESLNAAVAAAILMYKFRYS